MKVQRIEEVYLSNGKAAYSLIGSGLILFNRNVFRHLNESERTFVLLHEAGHIEKETTNEVAADDYALCEYVKLGLDTSHIISAMDKVLSNKPQNLERKSIMKQKISKLNKYQSVDGPQGWGDWLALGSSVLGIGSEIAGGTTAEQEAAALEAKKIEQEESNKKTISYILAGLAIVAVAILIFKYNK